jgi:uncharacterized membrane protein
MNYIEQHPFTIVLIVTFIFMAFILKEDWRAVRHRKHQMDIEKRKKEKQILKENKNG